MFDAIRDRLEQSTGRGLADAVSAAIRDEAVHAGQQLPPIRTVATELGVSPTTVSAAWSLLARAGAITTDGRRGSHIAVGPPPSRYRRALDSRTVFDLDLAGGVPDPALLPDIRPALRRIRISAEPSSYLDDPVLPELAERLRSTWPYQPDAITLVDGAMDALDLATRTFIRHGDHVAVEDPTFPPLLDLLDTAGARVHGVSLDEHGMKPDALSDLVPIGLRAVFLQPRGHNPTGASLSPRRVAELARTLGPSVALIVEDDSAGDIAYAPPVSLGSRLPDRTLHIRSFSKSHGPDLRLAGLSGPTAAIEAISERRMLGQGWSSRILQALLLELLSDRRATHTVEAAREEYARRRSLVVSALRQRGVEVSSSDGINIWMPVADEAAAVLRLASHGIGAAVGRPFCLDDSAPHLRITAGLVARDHDRVADELAEAAHAGAWAGPR